MIIIIQLLTEDEVGADHVNKEHVEDQKEKVKLEHRGVGVRLSIVTNLQEGSMRRRRRKNDCLNQMFCGKYASQTNNNFLNHFNLPFRRGT